MNARRLRQDDVVKTKQLVNVKVTIEDSKVYEVDSYWSQETQEFCEKIADEVKRFVEKMNSESEVIVE